MDAPRVALFHDTFRPGHWVVPLLRAFADRGVELVHTPRGDTTSADPAAFDAIIVLVRFRHLIERPPIDWKGFGGIRAMLEFDAVQNYSRITTDRWIGTWPPEFHRQGFDLMLVSGREVAERLREDGIPAAWVPKGYDERTFYDEGRPRAGVCHFGSLYLARAAMLRQVRKSVDIRHVRVPFERLNGELNAFAACVVCNMEGTPRLGRVGRMLQRLARGALVEVRPGVEVLGKNFEVAAAGCAPFFDAIPELEELGFVDGETAFLYSDFDELAERLRTTAPEELNEVGRRAAELARERHTWAQRVDQMLELIAARTPARTPPGA